jgi:hypothetical protein
MSGCKRAYVDTIFSAFRCKVPDRFSKYPRPISATTSTAAIPTSTTTASTAPAWYDSHCPEPSVRRHMQAVEAEFRSVLKEVARVVHSTSTERSRIRTAAGRILYRTRRLPWERELFGYAHAIRRLNEQLESKRMRAVEQSKTVAVRDRLLQRLQDDVERHYDAC